MDRRARRLLVAVHHAGAVDGTLIQRRPPQVVLAAGEFRRPCWHSLTAAPLVQVPQLTHTQNTGGGR